MLTLRLTGIGRYSLQIVKWLSRLQNAPETEVYGSIKSEPGVMASGRKSIFSENRLYRALFGVPKWAREKKLDLYHATNYGSAPLVSMSIPWVLTVHDLSPLTVPEFYGRYFSLRAGFLLRHNISRASHIIAVSNLARKDTIEAFGMEPSRITTIHLALDEGMWWPGDAEKDKEIRANYGLNRPYLLFVGALNPRKNVLGLVRAYHQVLKEGKSEDHRLALAGPRGWKSKENFDYVKENKLTDRVIALGFVPGPDLPAIYRGATAFVYPSFYESFAYPVLEALTAGVPVITSNTSNIPEVAGPCSILVNPHSPQELTAAIVRVLESSSLRETMSREGREWSKNFSWEKTASQTLSVYKKVLSI